MNYIFALTDIVFNRSHTAIQLKTRPQTSSLPPAQHNLPQIQFQRFCSKSRLDYRYLSVLKKFDFGFCVSAVMISPQHMPQLLPRGEAFSGGTIHHTSRVCFGGPSLALLQQKLPDWTLQKYFRGLCKFLCKMKDR